MWDHVDGFGRHLHQKVVSAKAFSRLSNKTKTQTYNKSPKIYLHQKVVSCLSKKQKQYINPKIQFFFFSKPFLPFQKRRKKKITQYSQGCFSPGLFSPLRKTKTQKKLYICIRSLFQPKIFLTYLKKSTKIHLHWKVISARAFLTPKKKRYKKNIYIRRSYKAFSYPFKIT